MPSPQPGIFVKAISKGVSIIETSKITVINSSHF